jgi:hypothetical protein
VIFLEKLNKKICNCKGVCEKYRLREFLVNIRTRCTEAQFSISVLTPGIAEKKVPPSHQSRYIGSTLNFVYRKLKVVEAPITFSIAFANRKLKSYMLAVTRVSRVII